MKDIWDNINRSDYEGNERLRLVVIQLYTLIRTFVRSQELLIEVKVQKSISDLNLPKKEELDNLYTE